MISIVSEIGNVVIGVAAGLSLIVIAHYVVNVFNKSKPNKKNSCSGNSCCKNKQNCNSTNRIVKYTATIPHETEEKINNVANYLNLSTEEVFSKALALLFVCVEEQQKNNKIMIADENRKPIIEINMHK
jgi:hypothetical protein